MQAMADTLQSYAGALALLATGSAGLNPLDVDQYSDLDLLIVTTGTTGAQLLQNLYWLEAVEPIIYSFRYNDDCYKLLFADGVFCELSILDASLLSTLQYSGARIIWCRPTFDSSGCAPHGPLLQPVQWVLDELLTVLYTGLCKYKRGELFSANVDLVPGTKSTAYNENRIPSTKNAVFACVSVYFVFLVAGT
jgi:lincosamide nucleotidyltransferase B/F